jgi:hypothetical protein
MVFVTRKTLTFRQLVRVVVKYVDDHPEATHDLFVTIIHKAMITAWPCGKPKQ